VYFMSTVHVWTSTRGEGGPAHVDACGQGGGEVKNVIFCGRHKWMVPNGSAGFLSMMIPCTIFLYNGDSALHGLNHFLVTGAPGGRSKHPSPNISTSSVIECVRKYELSKRKMSSTNSFRNRGFLVKKGPYMLHVYITFHTVTRDKT